MKYKIFINAEFKSDFDAAYNYISNILQSKIAAKNLRKQMQKCIKDLSIIPEAYPKFENIKINNCPLRFCNCKNFVISFIVLDKKVYIYNFFYSKSVKYRNKHNTDEN